MPSRSVALALLISVMSAGIAVNAQDLPRFSADSELVVLHVMVKDRKGAYVTGLPQEAFAVIEDGRAQTVRFFTDTDTPVTVGLLIDSSQSMYAARPRVIAAATAFVQASHPQDEIFALTFNEDVQSVLPPTAPFTSESTVLTQALERGIAARGRTALYDGISRGIDYLARGNRERKVLIVVSDGGDNVSRATLDQVLTKTQGSNAMIYTIALIEPGSRDGNPKLLRQLAESTGGEAFRPDDPKEISDVLEHIARDIRHTYTVGYTSTNSDRDGTFRTVRVIVTAPPGRPLVVRSRGGYQAGGPKRQTHTTQGNIP